MKTSPGFAWSFHTAMHPNEVTVSMRPPHVFANITDEQYDQLLRALHHQHRVATRIMMILLSAGGMPATEIAAL